MFETALFISAFTTLFVIIDPPGCAPIFATLTNGTSRAHQRAMAFKSVGIAAVILIGFAYVGEWLFAKLGISLDALRIAGGIMLFIIGLNMVFEKRTESREERADGILEEIEDPEDISVFPMGIPMIAGPGDHGHPAHPDERRARMGQLTILSNDISMPYELPWLYVGLKRGQTSCQ